MFTVSHNSRPIERNTTLPTPRIIVVTGGLESIVAQCNDRMAAKHVTIITIGAGGRWLATEETSFVDATAAGSKIYELLLELQKLCR